MYIIYPPAKKTWGHHALTVVALAMLYPMMALAFPEARTAATGPVEPTPVELRMHEETQRMQQIGLIGVARGYYGGEEQWRDAYPLYTLIALSVAQKEAADFVKNARALKFLLAGLVVLVLFWTLRRAKGEIFGFLTIVAFLSIPYFFQFPLGYGGNWLLLLCCYLACFNLILEPDPEARVMTSGLWAGAAFLTAPAGGALLFAGLAYLVAVTRLRLFAQKRFWAFLIGFLTAASPLLVRDYRLTGNPAHSLLAFLTRWDGAAVDFKHFPLLWAAVALAAAAAVYLVLRKIAGKAFLWITLVAAAALGAAAWWQLLR